MTAEHKTAGYQRWSLLTFLHWRVPAELIQEFLPKTLSVDTFEGSAWLGVVPYAMERVRPWWSPPVPGVSWFFETNVRTYVRTASGETGVWFFSLDANQALAVEIARRFWNLPYKHASIKLNQRSEAGSSATTLHYSGLRKETPAVSWSIDVSVDTATAVPAARGSLEEFLVERYTLFCQDRHGRLYSGRVHHTPYTLCPIFNLSCSQTLTSPVAPQIGEHCQPHHLACSPGVDVRVSPLKPYRGSEIERSGL